MLKNLYQLRLLDFFELTAAIGGALYVYQSGAWWNFEKTWVIAALSMSAILLWIATRLSKKTPTPGLFLAAYTGALCGLADLSPWMAIFGRLAVIETAIYLFPDDSWREHAFRDATVGVCVVIVLMGVPTLLFGCAWSTLIWGVQAMRSKATLPANMVDWSSFIARALVALLFAISLGYFTFRPQIRLLQTIRIPFDDHANSGNEEFESEFDRSPRAIAWEATENATGLLVLLSDKRLIEFSLPSGKWLSECTLVDDENPNRLEDPVMIDVVTDPIGCSLGSLEFEPKMQLNIHRWKTAEGTPLLLVSGSSLAFYDLNTKTRLDLPELRPYVRAELLAISHNGRYAIVKDNPTGSTHNVRITIWDLPQLEPLHSQTVSAGKLLAHHLFIDNAGKKIHLVENQQWTDMRQSAAESSLQSICGASFRYFKVDYSDDGQWRLSSRGLSSTTSDENLLKRYWNTDLHGALDPSTGRVALFATKHDDYFYEPSILGRVPILQHQLDDAQNGQLTLFDPQHKRSTTSWLRKGLLRSPSISSSKFTETGRYLIIQDEDESADLFHVFAMP